MRGQTLRCWAATAVGVLSLAILAATPGAADGLGTAMVQNPGFEKQEEAGGPSGWSVGRATNGGSAAATATDLHSGQRALVLSQAPLALPPEALAAPSLLEYLRANNASGFVLVSQTVPVEEGKSYNLRFWLRTVGLVRENRDDPKAGYAAFQVWIFWMKDPTTAVAGDQGRVWVLNQQTDVADWTEIANSHFNMGPNQPPCIAPAGAKFANIRFQLPTTSPGAAPKAWVDDVRFWDAGLDEPPVETSVVPVAVPNPGFEEAEGEAPKGWRPFGSGVTSWVGDAPHAGNRCVSVSDAGMGTFSGWATELPATAGSAYVFSGWVKGGALTPNSVVGGGALCLQFLDNDGQVVGESALSKAIPANTDWTSVQTERAEAPNGAVRLRLTAGLQYCQGTAWFDDLALTEERAGARAVAMVRRPDPKPVAGLTYATDLLANGVVEEGEGDRPRGWTYVGSSEKDWTPEQIAAFHRENRPDFGIGRGKGEWSRKRAYAGQGALLNTSLDPPLSGNLQWYGLTPVDAYWLSDPMPCEAGKGYLASAWVRPGVQINSAWYGPLEIRFFDANGGRLRAENDPVRPALNGVPAGAWTYWATLPYLAPAGARTMRLRFGQELSADSGGWGRTYGDNFAVWESPEPVTSERTRELHFRPAAFRRWFHELHANVKPPYLPSPTEAPEYESAFGAVLNGAPGNVFHDPKAATRLPVTVGSLIGEARTLSLRFERFDHLGNLDATVEVPPLALSGSGSGSATVELPPAERYGTFYLEGKVLEGEAIVGQAIGRYAVLPEPARPRSADNIWAVTLLAPVYNDGRPYEAELGELLRLAGFGLAWVRAGTGEGRDLEIARQETDFLARYGLKTVVQIYGPRVERPIDVVRLRELGRSIGEVFKGKVAAYGNWGVEQSNHRTVERPVYRPILNGKMLTDEEYDRILVALYEGLKAADPQTPVLIGNIATDWEAATVRRLYGEPVEGRFDGAILNAYMAILKTIEANLAEFHQHGDTHKTIWQEECADQRSPIAGPMRRRGEVEGAYNMVRTWLTVKCKGGPRVRSMTMWGFAAGLPHADNAMVTEDLQPRPQYAAHVVMADATADAGFVADRSAQGVTVFEWRRGDGRLFTLWSSAGERSIVLDAPAGEVTVMDCMGNRTEIPAADGVVSLKVTPAPIYVFGGGALGVSRQQEARRE